MTRVARHAALAVAVLLALLGGSACSKTQQGAGLEILLTTNLHTPADFDTLFIQVSQQTPGGGADGGGWTTLFTNHFRVPGEATFPTSFSIAAGSSVDQEALVQVAAFKDGAAVDLREAEVQVPTDRIAELTLVIAESCLGQATTVGGFPVATCPPGESCQPATGMCGPTIIKTPLPTYNPADLAHLDASVGAFVVDGGAHGGDGGVDGTTKGHDGGGVDGGSADGSGADGGGVSDGGVTILAHGQVAPTAIAVDSTSVYWVAYGTTSPGTGNVVKTSLAGGTPVTLAPGRSNPWGIAVDSSYVYWTEGLSPGSVMRVGLDGGVLTAVVPSTSNPEALALTAGTLYWTDRVDNVVARAAVTGGSVTTFATGLSSPNAIAAGPSVVVWTNGATDMPGAGSLSIVAVGGGDAGTLASNRSGPQGVALDTSNVYWVDDSGFVMKVPIGGGVPQTLATAPASAYLTGIAVGATAVCYTGQFASFIACTGLDGGTVSTLATPVDAGPASIAIEKGRAYWVDNRSNTVESAAVP